MLDEVNGIRSRSSKVPARLDNELQLLVRSASVKLHRDCPSSARSTTTSTRTYRSASSERERAGAIIRQWKDDGIMDCLIGRKVQGIGIALVSDEHKTSGIVAVRREGAVEEHRSMTRFQPGCKGSAAKSSDRVVSRVKSCHCGSKGANTAKDAGNETISVHLPPVITSRSQKKSSIASGRNLSQPQLTAIAMKLFDLINEERRSRNMRRLTWDDRLLKSPKDETAQSSHNGYMVRANTDTVSQKTIVVENKPENGQSMKDKIREGLKHSVFGKNPHHGFGCIAIFGNVNNLYVTSASCKDRPK